MRTFSCTCGNTIHFENSRCMSCGRSLGFLPDVLVMSALEPTGLGHSVTALAPEAGGRLYRPCANYVNEEVCNWMLLAGDPQTLCPSCRLNRVIPNLSTPGNRVLWCRIETAKRRLLYTLYRLRLPVVGQDRDPHRGLAFAFLADPAQETEFADPVGRRGSSVLTGHDKGLITINLAEADDPARERMREKMNELYRTLLGHFRHEIGHYYWERLVAHAPALEEFRALFGDERSDYASALQQHYDQGPRPGWERDHISAYASAHPWEDWAETWAHYLHMVDTLETAHDQGLRLGGHEVQVPGDDEGKEFRAFLADWGQLTTTMNALNRSMGLPDAYPFSLSDKTIAKLAFVHRLIALNALSGPVSPSQSGAAFGTRP
jgi:hypothetical protein